MVANIDQAMIMEAGLQGASRLSMTPAYAPTVSSTHYQQPAVPKTMSTYKAKGINWGEMGAEAVSTLALRRGVGTLVKEVLGSDIIPEWSVEESFRASQHSQVSPYEYNAPFNKTMRLAASGMNRAFELVYGKGRSIFELTEAGKQKYGNIALKRHDVTDEDIRLGYFRPRYYNISGDELEKIEAVERGDIRLNDGSAEALAVDKLNSRRRSWGEQFMRVSTDFAFMGQADMTVKELVTDPIRGAVDLTQKFLDPEWRNGEGYEQWKQNFSLTGEVKKALYDTVENAIRGDLIYDYAVGVPYVAFKEHFSRKRTSDNSELQNTHTFFNKPFMFYNWFGKFVWQDMMIDWWLRPEKSNLRRYLRDHESPEGTPFYQRAWNFGVDLLGFGFMRSYQILSHMSVAVSVFFSPGRLYGLQAAEEILDLRIDALLRHVVGVLSAAHPQARENLEHHFDSVEELISWCKRESRLSNPQYFAFDAVGRLAEMACIGLDRSIYHKLDMIAERSAHQYLEEYARGQHRENIEFQRLNNTVRANNPNESPYGEHALGQFEKKLAEVQDEIGHKVMKPAVANYANVMQQALTMAVDGINHLRGRDTTGQEYDKISRLSERAAASFIAYGPYFAAKRDGDIISKGSELVNKPVVAMQSALNLAKFHPDVDQRLTATIQPVNYNGLADHALPKESALFNAAQAGQQFQH